MSIVHVPFIVNIHKTTGDEDNCTYSSAVVSPITNTLLSTKGSKATPAKGVGRPKKRASPRLFTPAKKLRIGAKDNSGKTENKTPIGKKLPKKKNIGTKQKLHYLDEKSSSIEESSYENIFNDKSYK